MTEKSLDLLANQLESITKKTPCLSNESHLESLIVRLEEKIDTLKRDFHQGMFY
jgi:hypothetical protein